MIQFCYIASAITFADASVDQEPKRPCRRYRLPGNSRRAWETMWVVDRGAATDQQARIVGVNMQQRALFRRGLHRFNNMFTFS